MRADEQEILARDRALAETRDARAHVGDDVFAHVAAQLRTGAPVGRYLGDDLLGRLVRKLVQALLQRLAERDDRRVWGHVNALSSAAIVSRTQTAVTKFGRLTRCVRAQAKPGLSPEHNR